MELPEPEQNAFSVMDFHSHILPCVDDGSVSAETTRKMLDLMAGQGIRRVAVTPHFYPAQDSVERFQARRETAVQMLLPHYDRERHPQICLGAEVAYFHGISRAEGLDRLCLTGTRCLLLEMPYARWPEDAVGEVLALREERDLHPVLAHIERYLSFQKRKTLSALLRAGILFQCNAAFFLDPKTRKKALHMLDREELHLLGSDCHNLTDRAPNLGAALRVIAGNGLSRRLRLAAARENELLHAAVFL